MMEVWGFATSYLDHASNVTLLKLSLVESWGCDRRVASLRSETPKCVGGQTSILVGELYAHVG